MTRLWWPVLLIGAMGCGTEGATGAMHVDLAPCTGDPSPPQGCGARLRGAVAAGVNACIVLRVDGTEHHATWEWEGAGTVRSLGDAMIGAGGSVDVAVYLFSAPIDERRCGALGVDGRCEAPCVGRWWQLGASTEAVIDFRPEGECQSEGWPAGGVLVEEVCGGFDDDCDGASDEGAVCGITADGGAAGDAGQAPDGGAALDAMIGRDGGGAADAEVDDLGVGDLGVGDLGVGDAGVLAGDGTVVDGALADLGCEPAPEQCDGRDDDCDGRIDERLPERACWPEGVEPAALVGRSICTPGVERCEDGQWTVCDGVGPGEEACQSGADEDCDGVTDEGCLGGPCQVDADCPAAPARSAPWCDRAVTDGACGFRTPGIEPPAGTGCGCQACDACARRHGIGACGAECAACAARALACDGACAAPVDGSDVDRCATLCLPGSRCRPGWACGEPAMSYIVTVEGETVSQVRTATDGFGLCQPIR